MEDGTLVAWRVQPGSRIRRGDVVALVETAKGIIDIESFDEGVVESLIVQPGTRVPVGMPLALLEGEPTAPAASIPAAPAAVSGTTLAAAPAAETRRTQVSPAARTRAATLGVDLATVRGTGPLGSITIRDIDDAARRGTAQPQSRPAEARESMRDAIAASMGRSKREIPHYYLQMAMDFRPAASWLGKFNESRPVPERLLPAVLLIKATASAAVEVPGFNGWYGRNGFEPAASVHLGVAIALHSGGLVAPAILDAHSKPLPTIMQELQDLVTRARGGHMRSSEIASATLTITSLGEEGADALYPIIHPPQVAIVGFGSVLERPWANEGRIEAASVLNLTLAADHRVTDGRRGARFLGAIRDRLAKPGDL
jgi:pyruvate dehydrogenase E2 component (dihydrolipoamide acetyltransferase)